MRLQAASFLLSLCFFLGLSSVGDTANLTKRSCPCGFYDSNSQSLFTESSIVYFNETAILPTTDFVAESYTHQFEKGWNTQFRQGAAVSNVAIANSSSKGSKALELHVQPAQADHLVVGASLRTIRRDIQYGSFRSLMRSPAQWAGGSVLSMALDYNLTQMVTLNLQNADQPSAASVSMLEGQEFPNPDRGISYANMTSGTFGNGTISPWNYTEFRMDWTKEKVSFFIGGYLARNILKNENEGLFSAPSPLYFRLWSNGNPQYSQGPPEQPVSANVGWARLFFNSSLMTETDHIIFGERCQMSEACSVDDMTLRGSSEYSEEATLKWKEEPKSRPKRLFTIWVAVGCICLTSSLLLNPLWKRVREKMSVRTKGSTARLSRRLDQMPARETSLFDFTPVGLLNDNSLDCPKVPSPTFTSHEKRGSTLTTTAAGKLDRLSLGSNTSGLSKKSLNICAESDGTRCSSFKSSGKSSADSDDKTLREEIHKEGRPMLFPASKFSSIDDSTLMSPSRNSPGNRNTMISVEEVAESMSIASDERADERSQGFRRSRLSRHLGNAIDKVRSRVSETPVKNVSDHSSSAQVVTNLPEGKRRVDYFAGLVAVSTLLVTAIHFILTFVPGAINPGGFTHFTSETIARKTVTNFLLNLFWIGPFFMTSTRFLASGYLGTGDLLPVADKTVRRTFRLMVPVAAIALLEYFLIDCGATKWLEYLPSITWSTWPYVVEFSNFGRFLTELLELAYMIPNAVPRITFNYCIGVLWTIPVQLQGSWLILLAVIVIREVRSPWKRFGFYAFCVINHWYALSWGSYFYLAIMLVDLDVTYKWRTFLYVRPLVYYPLLNLCLLLCLVPLNMELISKWTGVNYATFEYGIHPDPTSGLPRSQAGLVAYPEYYVPRLNGIVFAFGLQAAVGLSPVIQKILSFKLWVLIFPHIFTIYLIHGFVFWSLGSWLCATLSVHGLPYWANVLTVAFCCYTTIAISLPLLTPLVETLGNTVAKDIWQFGREEPLSRRPTLYPFPKEFFLSRQESPA